MLVTLGSSHIYFNEDDVLYVERLGPDAVEVAYAFGNSEPVNANNYNNDPGLVNKLMDAFVNAGLVRLDNGNRCVNVKRVRQIVFNMGEATIILPNGHVFRHTADADTKALYLAVGGKLKK